MCAAKTLWSTLRVDKMVEQAIAVGAKVIVPGRPPLTKDRSAMALRSATFFEVTDSKVAIAQEEIFGAVLTMMAFDTARSIDAPPIFLVADAAERTHARLLRGRSGKSSRAG
jgi:hypothetical protein